MNEKGNDRTKRERVLIFCPPPPVEDGEPLPQPGHGNALPPLRPYQTSPSIHTGSALRLHYSSPNKHPLSVRTK